MPIAPTVTAIDLINRIRDLKAPSVAVCKLIAFANTPDADNDELIRIMQQDAVLCAKLLALCNRASVGIPSVASIDLAVLYLGHRAVQRLALSIGFGAALNPALPGYAMKPSDLWRHSLLTGHVTQQVVHQSANHSLDPTVAYTCGLLHDIGKVVIGQALDPVKQRAIRALLDAGAHDFVTAEREVIGVDHAEVGATLLEKWGIPKVVVEAVRNHHTPVLTPTPQFSAIVHVADLLAHQTGFSPGLASFALKASEESVHALGLDLESWEKLLIATLDTHQTVEELASAA